MFIPLRQSLAGQQCGITFGFERIDRQKHLNGYTFYLKYVGPLPAGSDVKVDVTLRERLVYPLQQCRILRGYVEFTDLPMDRTLHVYSLNEIAAEKTMALADRARSEPRDLYDLWYLTSKVGMELSSLVIAIQDKLAFRDKPATGLADAIQKKEARLKALWSGRLAYQMTALPEFDTVFREVRRALRQADLP
jgi:predicted nucleotidyltransferase component of viral defense system